MPRRSTRSRCGSDPGVSLLAAALFLDLADRRKPDCCCGKTLTIFDGGEWRWFDPN